MNTLMSINPSNINRIVESLNRDFVGFDRMFERMSRHTNADISYPPYNISVVDKTNYEISLAVAGFSESEIGITLEDRVLKISGAKSEEQLQRNYIHRGLAFRSFERTFVLSEDVEVRGAHMDNGLLVIRLEHVVPEEKKPKVIQIESKPFLQKTIDAVSSVVSDVKSSKKK